jgi:hypothetical protein
MPVKRDLEKQPILPAGWRWAKLGEVMFEALPGFAIGERDVNGVIQLPMNNVDTRGRLNWPPRSGCGTTSRISSVR